MEPIIPSEPLELNAEQAVALKSVIAAMERLAKPVGDEAKPEGDSVFLLHGVTGSGKTEVYLQAIDTRAWPRAGRHRARA